MIRLNREIKSMKTQVKNHCANYNTGYTCTGVMIGSKLQQWINKALENKGCVVIEGKECEYYNQCVKPIT